MNSDPEGERPVRKQLEKTKIDANSATRAGLADKDVALNNQSSGQSDSDEENASRLRKKRSSEEIEDEDGEGEQRKRSRDRAYTPSDEEIEPLPSGSFVEEGTANAPADDENATKIDKPSAPVQENGSIKGVSKLESADESATTYQTPPGLSGMDNDEITSPKNKRKLNQLQSDKAVDDSATVGEDSLAPAEDQGDRQKDLTESKTDEPQVKRKKDISPEPSEVTEHPSAAAAATTTAPTASTGFGNTSATSPFATAGGNAKQQLSQPQTSSSAFTASGFSALANSSASPFGGLGNKSGSASPFAAAAVEKKSPPTFASAANTSASPFGAGLSNSSKSAFGGGSPFGNAIGSKGFGSFGAAGLSSFAGGSGKSITGLKGAKPFGSAGTEEKDDEDSEAEKDEETELKDEMFEEDKKDERFYERESK
jgi:Ran-binding protein 3